MEHNAEAIRKETRTYISVFIALAVLTVLTVGVSYFHLPPVAAIGVALVIAACKGSLVAGFFMHLAHERKLIYWVLILTVIFFLFLLLYPTFWHLNLRRI